MPKKKNDRHGEGKEIIPLFPADVNGSGKVGSHIADQSDREQGPERPEPKGPHAESYTGRYKRQRDEMPRSNRKDVAVQERQKGPQTIAEIMAEKGRQIRRSKIVTLDCRIKKNSPARFAEPLIQLEILGSWKVLIVEANPFECPFSVTPAEDGIGERRLIAAGAKCRIADAEFVAHTKSNGTGH